MLKFFRKYNKWILAIGCSILMVAFMLPSAQSFLPSPESRPIGKTAAGKTLKVRDLKAAEVQLGLYDRISPILGGLVRSLLDGSEQNLHWALIKEDARAMGLSASNTEVQMALQMFGISDDQLKELAQAYGAKTQFVRASIADWLMAEQYRDLMRGRTFETQIVADAGQGLTANSSPGLQRLMAMNQAYLLFNIADQSTNWQDQQRARLQARDVQERAFFGSQRLSGPMLRAAFQDARARVSGRLLLIPAQQFVDQAAEPTDAQIAEQFQQYKDALPGDGEPYGFGYRLPDRVKLEYLSVSYASAWKKVAVPESEALAEYDRRKSTYTELPGPDAGPDAKPRQLEYTEVRERLIAELKDTKAREKVTQVIRAAQGRLADAERTLPEDPADSRYKAIPDDYVPLSFDALAEQLTKQFGIEVEAERYDKSWIDEGGLETLPGIGRTAMPDASQPLWFTQYVLSARAFDPPDDDPAASFRLQRGIASKPMAGFDRSMYLFRLINAQPSHALTSPDTIREQVADDVRLLQAYQKLVADASVWRAEVATQTLDEVAKELSVEPGRVGPISKRIYGAGRDGSVPVIPGIGQNTALIDTMFDTAVRLHAQGELADLPVSSRTVASPIDAQLKLAIVELDDYEPVTFEQYENNALTPTSRFGVSLALVPFDTPNPMTLDLVKQRVGYTPTEEEERDPQAASGNGTGEPN